MWSLILMVYVDNVNLAEVGFVRRFKTEAACEAAGELVALRVKKGLRYSYLCVPTPVVNHA